MPDLLHLYRHGLQYYYDRKIPDPLKRHMPEPFTGKARYRVKLGTTDLADAQRMRAIQGAQFELALLKARKIRDGKGGDDEAAEADRLALQLREAEERDDGDHWPLPDEERERTAKLVPPALRNRFWNTYREGQAPTPVTAKVDEWIAHTDHIRSRTALERRTAVEQFHKWFKDDLQKVTRDTAKDYRKHLQTKVIPSTGFPMASGTVNKRLQGLSLYWKYLEEEKVIPDGTLWEGLQKKKARSVNADEKVRGFTTEEIKALFKGGAKSRLMDAMTIAFFTGAREGEIGNLKVQHIDLEAKTLKVPGTKNESAPRLIPMHDDLFAVFTRRINGKNKGDWVIEDLPDPTTLQHGRERGAALSQAFTNYRRKVGVNEVVRGKRGALTTFHSFRHYVATTLKEAGVPDDVRDALQGWARGGAMRDRYASTADMMRLMREALGHLKLPE
jgi:integrase